MNITLIEIEWSGPYVEHEFSNLSEAGDYGLYQLYGTHEIYGSDSLLYIGKTTERSFTQRLNEHKRDWFNWQSSPVSAYVGRIGSMWLFRF